jgi:ATP-dependent protease ClpP protease subunit
MLRFKVIFVAFCFLAAVPCYGIDVTRDTQSENVLHLSGTIIPGDLNKIIAEVTPPATFPTHFELDSPGGDILEAMAIGRFIRKTATGTIVRKDCESACVFILIAGVRQNATEESAIGLHRPYFYPKEFAGLSFQDAEEKYKVLQAETRRYLEEMEMATSAIEKMFSIPSDDVYFLTPQEKARLFVGPSAYAEWIRAKCSPPTVSEWELFKARGFSIIDQFGDHPPTDPAYTAFISKFDQSHKCERDLVGEVRQGTLRKYGKMQYRGN